MPFTEIEKDILHTLMYYDIFSYPLTIEELFMCSKIKKISSKQIQVSANQLVENDCIYFEQGFYSLEKRSNWIQKRLENNKRATEILPKARKISQFIGSFPYIRAVFLSGSISKNVFEADGDIDFFMLTQPQRLWLTRTLLILYRKIFLFNSHKYFCVNYFIDTENLEIEDKNLFTATELSTLIPTFGKEYYLPLMEKNEWYRDFFPNFPLRSIENVPFHHKNALKTCIEYIFDTRLGDWLDDICMRLTLHYRRKKFANMTEKDFDTALKTRKYVSKHHPNHFQKKVENALNERKKRFFS